MTSKKKKKKMINLYSRLLSVLIFIIYILFLIRLNNLNILPVKYYLIIISILVFIILIHGYISFKVKKKYAFKMLADIVVIVISFILLFGLFKINDTIKFLKNLNTSYSTELYYFISNSESVYNSLNDINGKNVYYYKDLDDYSLLIKNINEKITINIEEVNDLGDISLKLVSKNNIVLINSGLYDVLIENNDLFSNNTKIIGEIEYKVKNEIIETNIDITNTPFIIYLSGIDTRTNYMPSRSLSDVNMLMVVNPKNKKILLVNVPRDYYVRIHGTSGLNDKLTHAGGIGGVMLSKATLEDLLGVNADYYLRVNFNAVIKVVDAIGGINIYSDVNYSFNCHTDASCIINPGNNYLNGKCALAFARERKAYNTGDRHRGENQEQVITKIIDKLTSSSSLISNYSNILGSLSASLETSISYDDITSLVKYQLNNMTKWNIETYNLNGTTGSDYTYSYPNQLLSIMYPDYNTVEEAKIRINKLLNE